MSDLAHLKIWDDPAIRDSLSWYLDVAENRRPAKFQIAATLATQIDPVASSEDALWAELDRLTPIFLGRWQAIRAGAPLPVTPDGPTLLEVCRELAYAHPLQFLSVELPRRPDGRGEVRRLQTRLGFAG
jgi:putative pyruvate formate lyase activating enzyme